MIDEKEKQKRSASADPLKMYLDSTQDFFDMWMNTYQSTVGKIAQVPAFGPVREKQEKMMKGFPIYVNLYSTWVESNINFQSVFADAMRKTYEKMIRETKGELTVEKYKDFYNIWMETYSEALKQFTKSGHFTDDMGRLMTNFMDFQSYNKDMIEENLLKPGNLPTKTDIDNINKELYDLRKSFKDLYRRNNQTSEIVDYYDEKLEQISQNLDQRLRQIEQKIVKYLEDVDKNIDKKIENSIEDRLKSFNKEQISKEENIDN